MYYLELTKQDRRAIDWIGHRYSHGNDLFDLLWLPESVKQCSINDNTILGKHADWNTDKSINFGIPEAIAWQVKDLIDNSLLDCFAPSLVAKLRSFAESII